MSYKVEHFKDQKMHMIVLLSLLIDCILAEYDHC